MQNYSTCKWTLCVCTFLFIFQCLTAGKRQYTLIVNGYFFIFWLTNLYWSASLEFMEQENSVLVVSSEFELNTERASAGIRGGPDVGVQGVKCGRHRSCHLQNQRELFIYTGHLKTDTQPIIFGYDSMRGNKSYITATLLNWIKFKWMYIADKRTLYVKGLGKCICFLSENVKTMTGEIISECLQCLV